MLKLKAESTSIAMTLAYIKKLGLWTQKTNVRT